MSKSKRKAQNAKAESRGVLQFRSLVRCPAEQERRLSPYPFPPWRFAFSCGSSLVAGSSSFSITRFVYINIMERRQ
jgi:hypothetical protein